MNLPRVPQRTTPGFAFSMVERALQECLATRKFGQEEIKKVLKFFRANEPECVFCGSSHVERWDHLMPVSKGGETVLGNMVPACAQCDDAMRELPFDEWMVSDDRYSPKSLGVKDIDQRIKRIKAYINYFDYTLRSLEQRLNKQELKRLKTIRSKIQEIRGDIEALIDDHRTRRSEIIGSLKPK